jgi:hypothetical protein
MSETTGTREPSTKRYLRSVVVFSWVVLLLAGAFAYTREVFGDRIPQQIVAVRTGIAWFAAFLTWIGVGGALNAELRERVIKIVTHPASTYVLTLASLGGAVVLSWLGWRMTEVSFDCGGSVDGQVTVNGRTDADACKKPIYVDRDAAIEWRTSVGLHPPTRLALLPKCAGRTMLCTGAFTLAKTAIDDRQACPRGTIRKAWSVAVSSPRGSPPVTYLHGWLRPEGAVSEWRSECSVVSGSTYVVLRRGLPRCWTRTAPNYRAELTGCAPLTAPSNEPEIFVSADADAQEDLCQCKS